MSIANDCFELGRNNHIYMALIELFNKELLVYTYNFNLESCGLNRLKPKLELYVYTGMKKCVDQNRSTFQSFTSFHFSVSILISANEGILLYTFFEFNLSGTKFVKGAQSIVHDKYQM